MKPELSLLKLLLDVETYTSYRQYIDVKDTDQEIVQLYKVLDECHDTYKRSISFDEFYVFTLHRITHNQSTIKVILDRLSSLEIGKDIALTLLNQIKEKNYANQIAIKAIQVVEGKYDYTELLNLVKSSSTEHTEIDSSDDFVDDKLINLYEHIGQRTGLRWRLKCLNRIFGSLRKGNFGFLFARPESGKTTFLASEGTYFAEQLPEDAGPILWFNNEEDGRQVQIRCIQAALGVTRFQLFSNIEQYQAKYLELIRGKLRIVDNASIHRRDVEKFCEKYNPSGIIFDQADKVKGFDGDREDLKLGSTYQWMREIAKSYCPVIAVTQADGSGEGKKWLTMENVANAKTAKQAEADWILGIGATHQEGFEYVRHLHASKNKLPGDEDSDPKMRHGKVDVIIDPEIARYKDFE